MKERTRKFNGVKYEYSTWMPTLYMAEVQKERTKKSGKYLARIVKTTDGYNIFVREK